MNPEAITQGYINLTTAILENAIREAKQGDIQALDFLNSRDGRFYAVSLGLDLTYWKELIDKMEDTMKEKQKPFIVIHQGIVNPKKWFTDEGQPFDLAALKPDTYVITIKEPPLKKVAFHSMMT